jgi:preprotein translocase subunit SecF
MEFFKKTPSVPFMEKRRWCYALSAVLILGSMVLLATRGLNLGIDFTGGVALELAYPQEADVVRIREVVEAAGFPNPQVQELGAPREVMVRVLPSEGEDINQLGARVLEAVQKSDPGVELRSTAVIGSQVGDELFEQGGLAMLFTLIMIMIYVSFRFEKKMAAGTVLAALHDPFVIFGFFSATQMTFDLSVLAAILAVIGYSINDTVVVFDRVREVFHTMRKATPQQVLNAAVNQTLSRTLMTSFSTLFVVLSLYLFGGEALKGFSLAIIVGVVVGTFSSIFVAAALAYDMKLNANDLMPPQRDKSEIDAMP